MWRALIFLSPLFFILPSVALAQTAKQHDGSQRSASTQRSAWVKVCQTSTAGAQGQNVCLTHHENLDSRGTLRFAAAVHEIEGQDKRVFMVTLPLGMRQSVDYVEFIELCDQQCSCGVRDWPEGAHYAGGAQLIWLPAYSW